MKQWRKLKIRQNANGGVEEVAQKNPYGLLLYIQDLKDTKTCSGRNLMCGKKCEEQIVEGITKMYMHGKNFRNMGKI